MTSLFRHESLEHERAQRVGEPLIVSPLSFRVLAGFVAALVACIGCFLYWGTYTNKQTVDGYVVPSKGVVTIYAPQGGTVSARYVDLGDRIQKGQKLFEIAVERSTQNTPDVNAALLQQFDARLQGIRTRLQFATSREEAKIAQLEAELRNSQAESGHLNDQLRTERSLLALAEKNFSRYQALARTNAISQNDLENIREKALERRSAVEQIEQNQVQLRARLDQIPTQIAEAKASSADEVANLKDEATQLEQQKLQLQAGQEVVARAPAAGVISSVMAEVGQNTSTASPLASILPEGSEFEVRLLVPTGAIGFVGVGQQVVLRYSAFPYQQFGLYHATLRQVSRSIIAPGELALPVNPQQPYYLATAVLAQPYVQAYGRRIPLAAGMLVSADIVINRERLYEWVLRPIESLRGRL